MSSSKWFACLAIAFASSIAQAQQAGKCDSVTGILMAQKGKDWQPVLAGSELPTGVKLVALFQADLTSANGAIGARMIADVGHRGPLPVLESAIIVQPPKDVDFDVSLERGLLVLVNKKASGSAHVDLRIRGHLIQIELKTPETKLGVEIYGRHAPGLASLKDDEPSTFVFALVVQGEVRLKGEKQNVTLHEPPGPALLEWNSIDKRVAVRSLEKLPDYAKPPTEDDKKQMAIMGGIAARLLKPGPFGKLAMADAILKADSPLERKVAITVLGALDEVPPLMAALMLSKNADTRDHAVLVLRHLLGREPGQLTKLEKGLTEKAGLKQVQAKNFIHLLIGFDDEERSEPDTYELLINGLEHPLQAIRAMSHWHLVRLVPAGKSIEFDVAAPPMIRQAGVAKWKELIPAGKLPASNAK